MILNIEKGVKFSQYVMEVIKEYENELTKEEIVFSMLQVLSNFTKIDNDLPNQSNFNEIVGGICDILIVNALDDVFVGLEVQENKKKIASIIPFQFGETKERG